MTTPNPEILTDPKGHSIRTDALAKWLADSPAGTEDRHVWVQLETGWLAEVMTAQFDDEGCLILGIRGHAE